MTSLLQNLKVIDHQSAYNGKVVDISIEDGVIADISVSKNAEQHNGQCISPGWFDLGVHLSDPGFEHKESLEALSSAAAFGGFTDILCYPNTSPVVDDSRSIKSLQSRAKGLGTNIHFMGALSPGANENDLAELYDMHTSGALAFSDGRRHIQSSSLLLRALQYMQAFDGLHVHYPEDADLAHGGQMNEGEESVYLGMKGIPEIAETVSLAKLLHLHDYIGGRIHLQPLTSAKALHAIEQYQSDALSVAVSISHLAWDDRKIRSFDTHYKLSPPLRSQSQREALIKAVSEGKIDAICSYHQAQGLEEKLVEWPFAEAGVLSLQTLFPLAMEHLVRPGHIELEQLVSLLTVGPRKILQLPALSIEQGQKAQLTVFAPDEEWVFDKSALFSRAVNSPLIDKTLKGKVLQTVK